MWECLCDCGKIIQIRNSNLKDAKSCGCKRQRKILPVAEGQRFGYLTALCVTAKRASGHRTWKCRCDCGSEVTVSASELIKGQKSCGCDYAKLANLKSKRAPGEVGKNHLFTTYQSKAKSRGLEFLLSFEEAISLTSQNCFYCGTPPSKIATRGRIPESRAYNAYRYNVLDRVDSSLGYRADNVVSCCTTCNVAKNNLTHEEFVSWVLRAAEHLRGRE